MTVFHEIKSQLAKLLATEDLVVEHKKVDTACFNVHTRVLTLPMWEKASSSVYDLLVGHEVGHALYTPDEDWSKQVKVPPQFVNVVEDVRIEKLMKRRYAGLSKTFYKGYGELAEEDFFQIADENIENFNLADKVNLYYKIGNFVDVPFDELDEMPIVRMIADCETFKEVLFAAEVLYKFCKEKQQENTQTPMDSLESLVQGQCNPDADDQMDEGGSEESTEEEVETEDPQIENPQSEDQSEDLEVKTMESLADSIKQLINNEGCENVYLELPHLDLNKIIVSNEEIHSKCSEDWNNWIESNEFKSEEIFGEVDKIFADFKKSAQKEVNYLVKEFECKKAADSYARASTSRMGVLDCSKLHTYKYNEDLFKKVTTLADGKSHGLVFILDWSGSMSDVMLDTVKQLFNLVWFCKKVSIPFEVFAFTNEYPLVSYDEGGANFRPLSYTKKENLVQVGEWFSLMNMLTSKTNLRTLENQMKNIFRIASAFGKHSYSYYHVPFGMSLSGTPLNETLVALHQILPNFQKENKVQKVQCVVLTDGEAAMLKYHRQVQRRWEDEPYMGVAHIHSGCFLRDRKIGMTYAIGHEWFQFTDVLLQNLRDNFKDVNFIGIRVLEPRDANSFIRRYYGYFSPETEKIMSIWRKEKAFTIKSSGYDSYFGMSANSLSQDSEFEVKEDATKTQIKSAFAKSLKSKKMNKKILGEFVELIA